MRKEEQIETFYSLLSNNYNDIKKKYKQFCFLNHITYSEDILNDTVLKVVDMINKKGLAANNEKEIESYFFKAFKLNTYQEHLQNQKKRIDENVDYQTLEIEDVPYDESHFNYSKLASIYMLNRVKQEFGELTAAIWRLRYMVKINGEELNYKKIKQMTNIQDVRKRIVEVNRYIRDNITEQDIKDAIKNNEIFI